MNIVDEQMFNEDINEDMQIFNRSESVRKIFNKIEKISFDLHEIKNELSSLN